MVPVPRAPASGRPPPGRLQWRGAWVRLISRNRIATPGAPLPVRLFNTLVMEPGSLIMERKMLLGIKERVERLAGE
jgi:hypothetical protein